MTKPVNQPRRYVWKRIVIAILGLILSVVFHELFHVAMHWGNITGVTFFRNGSITEITSVERADEDIVGEEVAAYLITILVMILTTVAVYKVGDSDDTRTSERILFPELNGLRKMSSSEFYKIATKINLIPTTPPTETKQKRNNNTRRQ